MNIIRSWNGRTIRIRKDRYVSLTDMAQATGKQFGHWHDTKSAKSYLETLSAAIGLPITELVQSKRGGIPDDQGTWGHPKVSLRFAQWCNDKFAVQVDFWIDELLTTGSVSLPDQKKLYSEWRDYEKFRFQSDTNRINLRKQVKEHRAKLNSSINDYFKKINRVATPGDFAKVADAINVALTGETSAQMKKRTKLDGSKLIADYMPENTLNRYSTTLIVTTNLILMDGYDPLDAVGKSPKIALPSDYKPQQIEFIDPLIAAERRIDMYLSGQLSLPWVK